MDPEGARSGRAAAEAATAEDAALFSNRGRFGDTGPPSALRFATPSRIATACGAVRRGQRIPCALPQAAEWPPAATPRLVSAAPLLLPVVARGVLLDVARLARRPWLPDGAEIGPDILDECAELEGVTLESGDAVLVRTGYLSGCAGLEAFTDYGRRPAPGLSPRCARWLYEREIALLGADTPYVEVVREDAGTRPLRAVSVEHTGVVFGENFHLDALGEACAADGEYAFVFVCTAPAPGAAASPFAIR